MKFFYDQWWLWVVLVAVLLILISSYSRKNLSNKKRD